MPKLCEAAGHIVDFNYVTVLVLFKEKQLHYCQENIFKDWNNFYLSGLLGKSFLFPFSLLFCFPCFHLEYLRPRSLPAMLLSGRLRLPPAKLLNLWWLTLCSLPPQSRVQVAQQIRLTHSWGAEPVRALWGGKGQGFWTDSGRYQCSATHWREPYLG